MSKKTLAAIEWTGPEPPKLDPYLEEPPIMVLDPAHQLLPEPPYVLARMAVSKEVHLEHERSTMVQKQREIWQGIWRIHAVGDEVPERFRLGTYVMVSKRVLELESTDHLRVLLTFDEQWMLVHHKYVCARVDPQRVGKRAPKIVDRPAVRPATVAEAVAVRAAAEKANRN